MYSGTLSDIKQMAMGAVVTVVSLLPVALGCATVARGWPMVAFNASIALAIITWVGIFIYWGVQAVIQAGRESRISAYADKLGADLDAAERRSNIRAVER